jgi:hypothetical protein
VDRGKGEKAAFELSKSVTARKSIQRGNIGDGTDAKQMRLGYGRILA